MLFSFRRLATGAVRPPSFRCFSSAAGTQARKFNEAGEEDEDDEVLSPGARKDLLHKIVRVDHAGEFGAERIYAGQLAVLRGTAFGEEVSRMKQEEAHHLEAFDKLLHSHDVRPTLLHPVWDLCGWLLGAGTALLGREAAMACTEAVESVIGDHYNDQVRAVTAAGLDKESPGLRAMLSQFRDEELGHRDTGTAHDAAKAPAYGTLTKAIKGATRGAILISERI